MRILVILPVYNEGDNLQELAERILSIDSAYAILIIDDNSTDNSSEVSMRLVHDNPERVFFIRRKERRGRGRAVIEGYRFAISKEFDYVIEMDADLSHPPEYIPVFLNNIDKDTDMIIGSRYIKGGKIKSRPLYRNLISYIANMYLRCFLNLKNIKDITSGYRCLDARFLKNINLDSLESDGPQLLQEIILKNRANIRIKEIPIVFENRIRGRSKFSFFTMVKSIMSPLRW